MSAMGKASSAPYWRVAPAVPQDCTVCHYPLMADRAKADATSGVSYTMRHQSAQLGFQNCQVCHLSALLFKAYLSLPFEHQDYCIRRDDDGTK